MAEAQPPTIVEGATTGDVEDEIPVAKSAEDRKAQAALSSLDAPREDESNTKNVDQDAVRKAMDRLAGKGTTNGTVSKKDVDLEQQAAPVKKVKIDPKSLKSLVCVALFALYLATVIIVGYVVLPLTHPWPRHSLGIGTVWFLICFFGTTPRHRLCYTYPALPKLVQDIVPQHFVLPFCTKVCDATPINRAYLIPDLIPRSRTSSATSSDPLLTIMTSTDGRNRTQQGEGYVTVTKL
jgi:hypothetical protein